MFGPKTEWKRAGDVAVGDRIAQRNICGGLDGWLRVTAPLLRQCITCATGGPFPTEDGGGYVVRDADEMVEVAA